MMRTRSPLKRRVALRRVSKRRQREGKEYMKLREEFLRLRPVCEAHSVITGEKMVFAASTEIHHKKGRYGGNYLDKSTWLAICHTCHRWIHDHPKQATELGLLR